MPQNASRSEVIETGICTTWMGKDRIIWIKMKPVDRHAVEDAHDLVESHNRLAAGTPCRIICDMRHATTGADRAARDYYVGPEASEFKVAMAMVVSTRTQHLLGTLFLRLNRPNYPMKLFRSPADAIAWLEQTPSLS
jgi:hypothetical protein